MIWFLYPCGCCSVPFKMPRNFIAFLMSVPELIFFCGEMQSWGKAQRLLSSPVRWMPAGPKSFIPHPLPGLCWPCGLCCQGEEAASCEHLDLSQPIILWQKGSNLWRWLYKHIFTGMMLLPCICQKQLFCWISSLCCQGSGYTLCGLNEVPC